MREHMHQPSGTSTGTNQITLDSINNPPAEQPSTQTQYVDDGMPAFKIKI